MTIPWQKLLIAAAVGYGALTLLKPRGFATSITGDWLPEGNKSFWPNPRGGKAPKDMVCDLDGCYAKQGFFGFSGPQFGSSQDVQTPNCTPSNMSGNGLATYCNPPGVECAQGVDCADARVQYCRQYARGGVCMNYGQVAPNQGLPGQGPVMGSPLQDIANSFGFGAAQQFYQQQGYGYPQQGYGYNYPQQGYGYGYPQYPYSYPQQGYGYGYGYPQPYSYPQQPFYSYGYPRRTYQGRVTGYDKKSGHFLYG